MRLAIGTKLNLRPAIAVDTLGRSLYKPIPCTVVYINKPHRFFTAEFVFPNGGSFRESFKYHYTTDVMPKKQVFGRAFSTWKTT